MLQTLILKQFLAVKESMIKEYFILLNNNIIIYYHYHLSQILQRYTALKENPLIEI